MWVWVLFTWELESNQNRQGDVGLLGIWGMLADWVLRYTGGSMSSVSYSLVDSGPRLLLYNDNGQGEIYAFKANALRPKGKFDLTHVQDGTLGGGVRWNGEAGKSCVSGTTMQGRWGEKAGRVQGRHWHFILYARDKAEGKEKVLSTWTSEV
jgi:hypothetical protein